MISSERRHTSTRGLHGGTFDVVLGLVSQRAWIAACRLIQFRRRIGSFSAIMTLLVGVSFLATLGCVLVAPISFSDRIGCSSATMTDEGPLRCPSSLLPSTLRGL